MKTNLLVAAALLVASTSFAQQTTVNNQSAAAASTASATASSRTDAGANTRTNAVSTAKTEALQQKKELSNDAKIVKDKTQTQSSAVIDKAGEETSLNSESKTTISAQAHTNTNNMDNKPGLDASLTSEASISAKPMVDHVSAKGEKLATNTTVKSSKTVHASAQVAANSGEQVMATAATASNGVQNRALATSGIAKANAHTAVNAGSNTAASIKPKPVALHMQGQVKAGAGIKLK